ncbi:hypothetical protein PybrP1_005444, partial [[Pythium] brassicae (nom. inval.)]
YDSSGVQNSPGGEPLYASWTASVERWSAEPILAE